MSVDLPAPFSPMRTFTSPGCTSKSTSSRAVGPAVGLRDPQGPDERTRRRIHRQAEPRSRLHLEPHGGDGERPLLPERGHAPTKRMRLPAPAPRAPATRAPPARPVRSARWPRRRTGSGSRTGRRTRWAGRRGSTCPGAPGRPGAAPDRRRPGPRSRSWRDRSGRTRRRRDATRALHDHVERPAPLPPAPPLSGGRGIVRQRRQEVPEVDGLLEGGGDVLGPERLDVRRGIEGLRLAAIVLRLDRPDRRDLAGEQQHRKQQDR